MLRAIYLDTNVFFECDFNVVDGPLTELGALAFKHGIELWSSDIALTELQIAMRDKIAAVSDSFSKAKSVLRYSQDLKTPERVAFEATIKSAFAAVQRYFWDEDVRQLSVEDLDESDIAKVFSDYFNRRGCFSAERKRSEFPDAFQVAMILRAIQKGESIVVLSSDKDFALGFAGVKEVKVKTSIQQVLKDLRQLIPSEAE